MSTHYDRKLGTYIGKQDVAQRELQKKADIAAIKQEEAIQTQETQEKQRLAEATSEVEERRARAKRAGGRSLLVKTSPRGVVTLGGN